MTDARPYLIDPSHERLLAPPPRCVSRWTRASHLAGALMFPGLIVGGGVWMVIYSLMKFEPTPHRVVGTIMCAGAILFSAGWFLNGTLAQCRREIRLLREGRILSGEVTACTMDVSKGTLTQAEGVTSEYTHVTFTIEYAFITPAETRRTGKIVRVYTEVPTLLRPQAGDAMAVLFLDEEKFLIL